MLLTRYLQSLLPYLGIVCFTFLSCENEIEFIENEKEILVKDTTIINKDTTGTGEYFPGENIFPGENFPPQISWIVRKVHTSDFTSVHFVNNQTGYICGSNGIILKTDNGGETYSNLNSGTNQFLYDIKFINASKGYAVGDNKTLLKTTDGGTTWSPVNTAFYEDYRTLYFINENLGFITGSNGIILRTSDGGKSWIRVYTGTYGNGIYGIYFLDAQTGFASGRGGTILKTTDAGLSWNAQTYSPKLGEQHILTSIYFTDTNNGFIVGGIPTGYDGSSVLLKTSDGGKNWKRIQLPVSIDYLTSVKFRDTNVGCIAGGHVINNTSTILKTTNGGETWVIENVSSTRQYGLGIIENNVFSVGMQGAILKNQVN